MHLWWNSWGRRVAVIAGVLFSGVMLFLLFCFYTPPGHAVVASLVESLSGGRVAIRGLSGALPNHLQAGHLELRDAQGTWLVADGVQLDWHLLPAISGHIKVERLRADHVTVLRRQIPAATATPSTATVDINDLAISRIELKPAVLGRPGVLTASGSLNYVSRHDVAANLTIQRLDGDGHYGVYAAITHDIVQGWITVSESGAGLAGGVIGMPDLGPVSLELRAGATGNTNTLRFKFVADLLDVFGGGTFNLAAEQADIDFSAVAPEMHPNKQLSWSTISAKGHFHGSFSAPDISADFRIAGLVSNGTRIAMLTALVQGAGGKAYLQAVANGLTMPDEKTGVFANAPLQLTADADLQAPSRPVRFIVHHPLLQMSGNSTIHTPLEGQVKLSLPSLAGITPLTGIKLNGNAVLTLAFKRVAADTNLNAQGTIVAQGDSRAAKLLGTTKFDAAGKLGVAGDIALRATLKGSVLKAEIAGSQQDGRQSFTGEGTLSDLSRVAPTLGGTLSLRGSLIGPQNDGKLTVTGTAAAAPRGMARQNVAISAEASGLPKLKAANVQLSGRFSGAPVDLNADITRSGAGTLNIALKRASWRSLRAQADLTIAGGNPQGSVRLDVGRLADFSPLVGAPLSGSLNAHTDFQPANAIVHATALNIASGETQIGRVEVNGTVANPFTNPVLALTINFPQLATSQVSGSASVRLSGRPQALSAHLNTALTTTDGQSFTVAMETLADTAARHVTIPHFQGVWRDQTVTLAAPASIDYANGLKFAATFVEGKAVQVSLDGAVPANPRQPMNVHATGTADLAVIGSGLASVGQSIRGKIAVDVTVTGSAAKPIVSGRGTLTGGQIRDFTRGLTLTNVEAEADAQGTAIRLTKFTASAGPGTITGSGTVDVSAPGMPVDMSFKASNARPVTSDLLTANMDADLSLKGHLSGGMTLQGQVNVRQGNINIPEKFPADVATLNVRRSHTAPPPPPATTRIALDLTVSSRGQIFVRGRGLEAEFEGDLKINGTTGAPQVSGALDMRRGTLSLAGANLVFQSGKISFNGQALRQRLDPSLDLVAQSQANGITATLKITGTASQPRIELSSSPQLPQDEVLAQLLFQQSAKSLSAMQLASVAQAAATLSGGGGGFDPVGTMRKSLGLDRLAVGSSEDSSSGSSSTTIEAGKYVLRNVYIGAKQDLSGGTRALVQVDITKHLKAQVQVNTGPRAAATTSTPLQDNGDSIGLSYQFEY